MADNALADVRDYAQLAASVGMAKEIVTKDYLCELESYEVCSLPEELRNIDIEYFTRLYKFKKIVSDKNENTIDKLVTVLNSAFTSHSTVITLIDGNYDHTDYYMGVVSKDVSLSKYDVTTQGEAFINALKGNFPGLETEPLLIDSIREICDNLTKSTYITSVSGVASLRNQKEKSMEKYVQGIEHLVDSLQGKKYSIVVISDPVTVDEISAAKLSYETLYTQLSPFLKSTFSFNESDTLTLTKSQTTGITETIGKSVSMTQNYSETNGWSSSSSQGSSRTKDKGRLLGPIGLVAAGGAAILLSGGAATPLVVAGIAGVGKTAGDVIGASLIGSESENYSQSETLNRSIVKGCAKTIADQSSTAKTQNHTQGESQGNTQGRTLQFVTENKTIKNLLTQIDKHIERLDKCEAFGAFNCSAYVISSDPETNAIAASGYNALMRGDNSSVQSSYINSWSSRDYYFGNVMAFLSKFSHPLFYKNGFEDTKLSPASMTNSYELAVSLGLPKKSINGLPVYESAAFGRNVYRAVSSEDTPSIHLGNVYHMGAKEDTPVDLDVKSLAMHTFITGSTGSGKSNTVYQIIRELKKQQVSFLVIEPAKGEYKHIFGGNDAKVFGSNPYYTPLLRINPFRFPKGIHVLEHIDRLIELFNVCWPMYAAMPAVLKDSVERAYISAGWDLSDSTNEYSDDLFPTFTDVLTELTAVMEESAFSQEVKDNYIGSLATRIKSLTNGIYRKIFSNKELGDECLFDSNVIVDLSRVGSLETKSMIMGILVMRLQEYRMTWGLMNSDLKHVTVLEEAHNLLKRTSTEQSSESSNLLGKSVEMLSNAIAEVRTYGEGFIIADQSPGLLDMSVIRNTNTKIIMRLPDFDDRNLVGKSANLSDEQIKELSKLPTGVAAVYQNDWLEPVLCKVDYKSISHHFSYTYYKEEDYSEKFKTDMLMFLLKQRVPEETDENVEELLHLMENAEISSKSRIIFSKLISDYKKENGVSLWEDSHFAELSKLVSDLIDNPSKTKSVIDKSDSFDELTSLLLDLINNEASELPKSFALAAVQCLLKKESLQDNSIEEIYKNWVEYIASKGVV